MHPLNEQLLQIIDKKKSNLCLALDVTSQETFFSLLEPLADQICLVKTHVDLLEDFSLSFIHRLTKLAEENSFLIFEDRKFADIGNTVRLQYGKGIYQIAEWAHFTNAHILPGPGIIEGLQEVGLPKNRALFLLAQMSSKGNFLTASYTQKALDLAEQYPHFVTGFIAQRKISSNPNHLHLTPGVQLTASKDLLGQNYRPLNEVLIESRSEIMIVGRGITTSENPLETTKCYRELGWDAFCHIRNVSSSS